MSKIPLHNNHKSFSDKNLWRMKQFYETYQNDTKLSALLRELHPKDKKIIENKLHNLLEQLPNTKLKNTKKDNG